MINVRKKLTKKLHIFEILDKDVNKEEFSKSGKRTWTVREKEVVLNACHKQIIKNALPGKTECLDIISSNPCLRGRRWENIKDYVRNHIRLLKTKKKIG